MKTIRIIVVSGALLASSVAHATFIQLGEIDLTGTFTLNHLYDFNNQGAAPFGWFGTLTTQNVTGIFAPYVATGDTLGMSSTALNTVAPLPLWTMGGFTFATNFVLITGPDAGRFCFEVIDLSGNGFDPNNYPPFGAFSHWEFIAPPYDISHFDHDITGPISLGILVGYDNGHVPETVNTGALLFFAVVGLLLTYQAQRRRNA
jgi:hypothetical protein